MEGRVSQHGGFNSNLDISGRTQLRIHDDALMHAGKGTVLAGEGSSPHRIPFHKGLVENGERRDISLS